MPKIIAQRIDNENILMVESDKTGMCRICDITTGTATQRLITEMVLGDDPGMWAESNGNDELLARALACKEPRESSRK